MEQWKEIPNYEGIYEASNYGRIRTKYGKTTYTEKHGVRVWKQRVLKTKVQKRKCSDFSDERVMLWKDGISRTWLVSRLIALTWCKGYKDGLTVNHIDGNPMNNHASNLEWISHKANITKGFEDGLYSTQLPCELVDSCGNKVVFKSRSSASRFLGRTNSYVATALLRKRYKLRAKNGEEYMLIA